MNQCWRVFFSFHLYKQNSSESETRNGRVEWHGMASPCISYNVIKIIIILLYKCCAIEVSSHFLSVKHQQEKGSMSMSMGFVKLKFPSLSRKTSLFRVRLPNLQKEYAQLLAGAAGRIDQIIGFRIVGRHHPFKLASQVLAVSETAFLPG